MGPVFCKLVLHITQRQLVKISKRAVLVALFFKMTDIRKNFDHWKFRMKIILDDQEVKLCIAGENQNPSETFSTPNKKCKALLIQFIENSHLSSIST